MDTTGFRACRRLKVVITDEREDLAPNFRRQWFQGTGEREQRHEKDPGCLFLERSGIKNYWFRVVQVPDHTDLAENDS
jgi:hypothetical protein